MRKIIDLIRIDFITMNGGKNNMRTIFVLMFIFCGIVGFMTSPLIGLECPLLMGCLFVPTIFQNERKYQGDKLHSLLPISRHDLVNARFMFTTALYTGLFLIFYLIMLLALIIKPYTIFMGDDINIEEIPIDIIALLVRRSDGRFTELGLFNMMYFSAFSFGLIIMSGSLRKHFKDSKIIDFSIKKAAKKDYLYFMLAFAVILFWILVVSGVLKIGTAIAVFLQLLVQLAGAGNGFLLGMVFVTIAVLSALYNYICTVLEYDEKEL